MSAKATVEQSSFSLPRVYGLPLGHPVNLTIRELELEFDRTFNLMGRDASGLSDLPELTDVLLSLEVHTPNFTSLMFDEYVRRQVDRSVVAGSLNLIEAEVWHTMRQLDELIRWSRDSIELSARAAEAGINELRQLSPRDTAWTVAAAVLKLEGYQEDLCRVRDWTLETVARIARAIEDWIAKVGTLAQIPGADGQMSSRGNEMAEEFQKRFRAVREHELKILQAGLDEAVGFALEKYGGVQLGERHDVAWVRQYVTANLAKWQQHYGPVAVIVEMRRSHQKPLDDYKGDRTKLLMDLVDRGYYTDNGITQTQVFRDLIHEAWLRKIPTRAIDSPYSFHRAVDSNFNDPYGRKRTSEAYWAATYRQIRESLPPDTRVLLIAGGNHSSVGAHVGIPTIDDIYTEGSDMVRSTAEQLGQSNPGTLALEPATREFQEPERKASYTEQEFNSYLQDWETYIGVHDGATIVVNPGKPTGAESGGSALP